MPKRTRQLFLAVALLTLAVYLVSARGLPQTFDEQIIYDTTASLVHGKADIAPQLNKEFPAGTPASRVAAGLSVERAGHRAGIYGLGTSLVGAPLYVVGRLVGELSPSTKRAQDEVMVTMLTDALITAATVFVLMLLCLLLGAPPIGAVLIGLSFGLGSYAYPHALTLFTEPGTALCVVAAVYFAIRASRTSATADLVASGAFAGAALLFRVSAALFLPLIGLWLLVAAWRSRASGDEPSPRSGLRRVVAFGAWFTAGAVGPLLLMLAVNRWRYGSVTNFGYALGTATNQSYPIVRGAVNQWFSSGKSLFLFAPIAVIVVLGLVRSVRKMPMEILLLGSVVLLNTLFFARVQFWSGDWAWGPRYLQIVLPCLAAMAAPLMDRRSWRRALVAVSVLGFVFAALPAVLLRFTLIFYSADKVMPAGALGPPVWDHSYYALVWHTLHWQQILYQLRLLPRGFSNSLSHVTSPLGPAPVSTFLTTPRLELWWLRARDLGTTAVLVFAVFPIAAAWAGVRELNRALEPAPDSTLDSPSPAGTSGAV